MLRSTEEIVGKLINNISEMNEVQAIGISGSKGSLPKAGEGDIDIFIYCSSIPDSGKRSNIMNQMNEELQDIKIKAFEGGHWGVGDFTDINSIETWLMYFKVDETIDDIEAILNGGYLDKLDNYYYPVGRLAMFKGINVLYDKNNFLHSIKQRLINYPEDLSKLLAEYHLDELDDKEDLERAVSRKDVLFYHFALDISIDHFLQALFAINKTYFPSRKRTIAFIEEFKIKSEKCNERLLEVIKLGGYPEGISQSYKLLCSIIDELKQLYQRINIQ